MDVQGIVIDCLCVVCDVFLYPELMIERKMCGTSVFLWLLRWRWGSKVTACWGGGGVLLKDWGRGPLSLFASALATGAGRLFYKEVKVLLPNRCLSSVCSWCCENRMWGEIVLFCVELKSVACLKAPVVVFNIYFKV